MDSNHTITRRAAMVAGVAPLLVPRHVLGGPGYLAPSDTLTIAAVGVGGMGRNYLDGCKDERIVAVCDLDWTRPTTQGVFQSGLHCFPVVRWPNMVILNGRPSR